MDAERIDDAFTVWWNSIARRGDPMRRPNLVQEAFAAGAKAALTPVSATKGLVPIVLYFATSADADEFVALTRGAMPGLRETSIDG